MHDKIRVVHRTVGIAADAVGRAVRRIIRPAGDDRVSKRVQISNVFQLADGKLLAVVRRTITGASIPFAERLLPRGQVDPSFSDAAFQAAVQDVGFPFKYGLDSRERLLVAYEGASDTTNIIRVNSDGSLDSTFGSHGQMALPLEIVTGVSSVPDGGKSYCPRVDFRSFG